MSKESNDLTAANRETWDSKAKDYDSKPWQKKIAAQVSEALTSHASWLGANWVSAENDTCRLLDYACGTGSVTRALSEHITHATGLDISPAMITQYTTLISCTHPQLNLSTSIADFCSSSSEPSDPHFFEYDVAGIALGFHHFASPSLCVAEIHRRLKKGAVLFIVDWLPNKTSKQEHVGHAHAHPEEVETEEWSKMKKTIKSNGFEERDMQRILGEAGFVDVGFVVLEDKFVLEMNGKRVEKTGFIARGRKA